MHEDIVNVYFLHLVDDKHHYELITETNIKRIHDLIQSDVVVQHAYRIEVTHVANVIEEDLRCLFRDSSEMLKITRLFPLYEEIPRLTDNNVMYFIAFESQSSNYLYIFTHENIEQEITEALVEIKLKEPSPQRVSINFEKSIKVKYKDFQQISLEEIVKKNKNLLTRR